MPIFTAAIITANPNNAQTDSNASLTKIDGREALLRSVELFLNRETITQIILVVSKFELDNIKQKYGAHLMFSGVQLIGAGQTWIEQVIAVAAKLNPQSTHLILHDAARPAVPYTDIEALMDVADKHPAIALAMPLRGPLIEASVIPGQGKPWSGKIHQLQTPISLQRAAFDELCQTQSMPTSYHLIEGSPFNVRVGTAENSFIKAMIGLLPKPKIKGPNNPFEEAQW